MRKQEIADVLQQYSKTKVDYGNHGHGKVLRTDWVWNIALLTIRIVSLILDFRKIVLL